MTNINDVFAGKSLAAADLKGGEPIVIIQSVGVKDFPDGTRKLEIAFVDKQKTLIANKTNGKRLAHMFGDETDNWIGKRIQLYTEMVDFQGKVVDAIRVRPAKPSTAQPAPRKPAAEFDDAVGDIGDTF